LKSWVVALELVSRAFYLEKMPNLDQDLSRTSFFGWKNCTLARNYIPELKPFVCRSGDFFFENELRNLISRTFMASVESSYFDLRSITSFSVPA
jgi:hypothetical protein